ncbi:TRAP transporter large permease [Bradyrhizobium sediminis]|uniref:TRAP transporter large permease protein n=1 Tax=Bradyrhizobium sediminis TaxID=2840469 RepID=A0A975NWS5_9BRAD|nr:TRAP transporter large permease [Bradyrhizobium sediminis]QWG22181.1 TRAP transporter large permease [Bradyrhizobium sediminis]
MAVMIMVIAFVVMLLLTAPVAFAIGVAAALGLLIADAAPLLIVPQRIFAGADSFVLLAIPLFILAGALMETGGISARLVDLARVLVGHIRGGLGMAVVVAEMFFSGISGSTVADVSAIGALMVPSLIRIGFKPDRAVAIVSASSAMGILIPPCLIMVIIAQIAGISVGALFLAGFIPAAVLALALMLLIYVQARREGIGGDPRSTWVQTGRAFMRAMVPLMMPVIVFGAILGGIADPTEAAVLAVAYAFVVGVFVYKEIRWNQLPKIFIDSAITSGIVIFMVGAASSFSWILAYEQVPGQLARLMLEISSSPMVFFILSIAIFTVLAAVLEGLPAIIICLPIFLPIATKFQIDPLHYSIVVVAATGLGLFLPPVGIGLYIASSFANLSADQTFRAMLPYTAVLALGIVVLMMFPWLTLVVPQLVFG